MDLYSRLREQFSPAALTLSVIAIVLALAGGAIAAGGGLSGKQKKEVKAIAKSFQGTGAQGAPGAPGTNGKDGASGEKGANGTNGTNGTNGKSVISTEFEGTNEPFSEPCHEQGGSQFEVEGSGVKRFACNGSEGPRGPEGVCSTSACHLPSDVTETGTFAVNASPGDGVGGLGVEAAISFNIPLEAPLDGQHVHFSTQANFTDFDEAGPKTVGCAGTADAPTAPSGHLCVYDILASSGIPFLEEEALKMLQVNRVDIVSGEGASVTGAMVKFNPPTSANGVSLASWAVTG